MAGQSPDVWQKVKIYPVQWSKPSWPLKGMAALTAIIIEFYHSLPNYAGRKVTAWQQCSVSLFHASTYQKKKHPYRAGAIDPAPTPCTYLSFLL